MPRNAALEGLEDWHFCPSKFFFFLSWGEIRSISPQRLVASRLLVEGWNAAVGRNCLNFAPGVVQNSFRVVHYSSDLAVGA